MGVELDWQVLNAGDDVSILVFLDHTVGEYVDEVVRWIGTIGQRIAQAGKVLNSAGSAANVGHRAVTHEDHILQ